MRFAPGAYRWATLAFVLGTGAGLVALPAAATGPVLAVAVLLFFRDPERTPPAEGFLAPADGKVSVVREEGDRLRVGVFMNVTDVHVNRAPAAGVVHDVSHEPGAHRPAFTKDSDRNEKVHVACETQDGTPFEVTLIAGAFARRIHPYVDGGEDLARGERIGHIAFGSRADVLLPPGVGREDVRVEEGEAVRAGETVVAGPP